MKELWQKFERAETDNDLSDALFSKRCKKYIQNKFSAYQQNPDTFTIDTLINQVMTCSHGYIFLIIYDNWGNGIIVISN